MATSKQIAANRRNAARSTGPRTPGGKAASRLNAVTHGVFAGAVVAKATERIEDWDEAVAGLVESLGAVDYFEVTLVEGIVACLWRLRRLQLYESESIDRANTLEPSATEGQVSRLMNPIMWDHLERYESGLHRRMLGLLSELRTHQAARRAVVLGLPLSDDDVTEPVMDE